MRLIFCVVWLGGFFFNDTATTEIYTLSLHDALPIQRHGAEVVLEGASYDNAHACALRSEEHTSELQSRRDLVCRLLLEKKKTPHPLHQRKKRNTRRHIDGQCDERRDGARPRGRHADGRHLFFFFNDTATTEIYTLSLHDALPISRHTRRHPGRAASPGELPSSDARSEEHTSELQSRRDIVCRLLLEKKKKR